MAIRKLISTSLLLLSLILSISSCNPTPSAKTGQTKAPISDWLYRISGKGGYGYIDSTGKVIVEPKYPIANPFADGLAMVKPDDKTVAYLDGGGNLIFKMEGGMATDFAEGLAVISPIKPDGEYKVVDKTGEVMNESTGKIDGGFTGGVARIEYQGGWGLIDTKGNVLTTPTFASIGDFHDGLAPTREEGAKYGYISPTGEYKIPPQYKTARPFGDGLALVSGVKEDGKPFVQFIDTSGDVASNQTSYYDFDVYTEGLVAFFDGHEINNVLYGYMDKAGKVAIQPAYAAASRFAEGLAAVDIAGKWGYIDKTGKVVIEPSFKQAGNFDHGLAYVYRGDTEGYIDKTGKLVWEKGG